MENDLATFCKVCHTQILFGSHEFDNKPWLKDMWERQLCELHFDGLSVKELDQVNLLNNIIEQIKIDLLTNRHNYLWEEDDNLKDDYEKGVMNTIRLIMHRVHCICD